MKATVGGIEVEGTSEEILALIRGYRAEVPISPVVATSAFVVADGAVEDLIFRAVKRRALSSEQTKVLASLKGNHPNWTTAKDLQKVLKFTASQLGGLFGAFGKRLSATEGYRVGLRFFEQDWDYDVDCYRYRLTDAALKAVLRAGI